MKNAQKLLHSFEEFENSFNPSEEKPTLRDRIRNSLTTVLLGVVFVHIFFHGSMIFVGIAYGEAFYWF